MKRFNKWFDKYFYDEVAGNPFRHNMFKAWEAGAEEKLKSMRCETCKYWEQFFSPESKGDCKGWLGRPTNATDGCIHRKQKEGK